jgi:DNA-binding transcriptional ArsR family regulator
MRRSHYNLAEAHYKRFQVGQDAEDERLGDAHAAAALKGPAAESDPGHAEATRNLKTEILGPRDGQTYDRLLPEEFAAHFEQMADVQRQRAVLAVPMGPQAHISAHLAIANAYLAISSKEREAALSLIRKHGLGDQFAAEFEGLRATFNRELTREQHLATQWQQQAGELLQEQRRIALLDHLFRAGSIQKSMYAKVCGVGLATASKHLSALAQLGLLEQTGNGPSTRYVLPQ